MPHEPHRVGIGNQIHAMTDALRTEQQRVANVIVGLIHFARMDRKIDIGILVAQLTEHRQKTQRITLVIVFATDHVHADIEITILIVDRVELAQPSFRIRREPQQRILETDGHTRRHGVRRFQAGTDDVGHLIARER